MFIITQARPIFFSSTSSKSSVLPPIRARLITALNTVTSRACRGPALISLPKGAGNLPIVKAKEQSSRTMRRRKAKVRTVQSTDTPSVR